MSRLTSDDVSFEDDEATPAHRVDPVIAARLADRYGTRRSRGSIIGWIVVAVVVAGLGAWYLWGSLANTARSVDVDDRGFSVVDDHAVSVRFQITSTLNEPVVCALEALDEEFGVVGWATVEYPASPDILTLHEETIRTVSEATTGIVKSCWVP